MRSSCDKRLFEPLGMKDTTFWPNEEQLERLAKSYKPNADKTDLEEIDRHAASSIRSTTARASRCRPAACSPRPRDVGRFCQMILNGGVFDGKRYLSEAAVKQMTSKQTGKRLKDSYGLGWSTGDGRLGHGGAYSTNMTIDPATRPDHGVHGPARRLSARRESEPGRVREGRRGTVRQVTPVKCRQGVGWEA